ncbi:hypothetical protein D7Y42_12285 [Stenotrophomonas maltophilia]|nr:hypothetical protein [Stenotrophomonas maltophilia]PWI04122.1 hypothetical protein DI494_02140 [Stenotrophomonas maltophilia]
MRVVQFESAERVAEQDAVGVVIEQYESFDEACQKCPHITRDVDGLSGRIAAFQQRIDDMRYEVGGLLRWRRYLSIEAGLAIFGYERQAHQLTPGVVGPFGIEEKTNADPVLEDALGTTSSGASARARGRNLRLIWARGGGKLVALPIELPEY